MSKILYFALESLSDESKFELKLTLVSWVQQAVVEIKII